MRKEIWVHELTGTEFIGRHKYLEFMRKRQQSRLAIRRLQAHHEHCWSVLDHISEAMCFNDIEIFLNDHHHEIESVCSPRGSRYKLDTFIKIKRNEKKDTDRHWSARLSFTYSCKNHPMKQAFWREDRELFPMCVNGLSDVLERLGFVLGSGSGVNGLMTYPNISISKAHYYNADVMERLAA